MVSAPSSPARPTKVFRGAECVASRNRTGGDGLPRLGAFARRDNSGGASIGDGILALACIICAVGSDIANLNAGRDLVEEIRQDERVADVASGDFDGSHLHRLFVDPKVELAPDPSFSAAMLAGTSLTFALTLVPVLPINRCSGPLEPR